MSFKLKIWNLLLAFWIIILVLRAEFLINLVRLWFKYAILLAGNVNTALQIIDFNLFDALLSVKLFFIIPVLLFLFRKRLSWLKSNADFSTVVLMLLFLSFLFAPIITDTNPEFQKDLRTTKLLAPFSSVNVIHLADDNKLVDNEVEEFLSYKNSVIHESNDENIILADKVSAASDSLIYWQNKIKQNIKFEELKMESGEPLITAKFYLLGSDEFGRDIFTRLIYGSRISLLVGIGSVLVSLIIGLSLGFTAGYKGGTVDVLLSRFSDLFLSFPIIYLVVLILALFGNSLTSVIIVLGLSGWMSLFKIVKSEVLSEKNKDYIVTSSMLGQSKRNILIREILPVIFIPVVVNIVFQFSNVILAESALSYLGMGTAGSYPSWGAMIESGQRYISKAWWMISFPGLILIFALFAANDFGKRLNRKNNPGIRE